VAQLAVIRDIRSPRSLDLAEDAADYQENLLAEFVLARSAHGVVDATVRGDLSAVEEFLAFAGVWAWEIEATHADRFLAIGQRDMAARTRQIKASRIATFYRFIECRYQGEIAELTGRVVTSPIDPINRPTHSGDFLVRIPPSPNDLGAFFSAWREAG
jgi:integrase/recombinase XerD